MVGEEEEAITNLHVAILSSPGMGHLIPVLLLANRLATHHRVRVTVLMVTTAEAPPESKLLKLPLHHLVRTLELPPVDISHLVDASAKVITRLCLTVRSALPSIHAAVAAMDPRPAALFVDLFGFEALPIAAELGISKYIYFPTNAWLAALVVYTPVLDQQIEGEYVDRTEPLQIPGCNPVRPEDTVDPMLDRSNQVYYEYLKMCRGAPLFDGILVNSWTELDHKTLKAFAENRSLRSVVDIPVHPIGPLTRQPEPASKDSDLFRWLDRQPKESVLFVSFGSGGMLSAQQVTELAWGLELSKQRFVWVVRRPTVGSVDDAFFNVANGYAATGAAHDYLPRGFPERTREVGHLVFRWAPQAEILGHQAIGGFLSHCGWNSTLESISNGVPMIAWPLYAEQKMNAAFLAEEAGVALRTPVAKEEVVGREEVGRLVRALVEGGEGKRLREKAKEMKASGAEALENGGPSHVAMCEVLAKIATRVELQ